MKRVVIVGSPGAGKTTFSRILATKTGLPLVHLDYHYHDKSKDYYNELNKPAWRAHVLKLMEPKQWILDGNYSSTFPERFKAADTIIFLDYPTHISFGRVLKRIVISPWVERIDMPDDWEEGINLGFLKFVWLFNARYRQKITNVLEDNTNKYIVVLKNPKQATTFLEGLQVV